MSSIRSAFSAGSTVTSNPKGTDALAGWEVRDQPLGEAGRVARGSSVRNGRCRSEDDALDLPLLRECVSTPASVRSSPWRRLRSRAKRATSAAAGSFRLYAAGPESPVWP